MAYEDYVKKDLAGYWYNSKYPPNYEVNGSLYHGYKDSVEETLFYDFAVQRYDLRFTYKGKLYHFLSDCCIISSLIQSMWHIAMNTTRWNIRCFLMATLHWSNSRLKARLLLTLLTNLKMWSLCNRPSL